MTLLDSWLKDILQCPNCATPDLQEDEESQLLRCGHCGLAYPFDGEGGFPILLVEEAHKVDGASQETAAATTTSAGEA